MKTSFLIVPLSVILLTGVSCTPLSMLRAPMEEPVKVQNGKPTPVSTTVTDKGDTLPNVPLTREILYRLLAADLAYQRGQWETAYEVTMKLAVHTRDPRLARRAAEMAIGAKQPNEAMAAVKLWHELAPQSEDATKYYLGFILISDNLKEAKPILEQRLKEATPKVRNVLMFQIQRLLAGTKDKAAAFQLLEELVTPYLNTAEAHVALAQGALAKGDRVRAMDEAKKSLAIKPDFELAALTRAQAYDSVDKAMASLEAFIEEHPQSREVRLAYARMLISQKKYDEARKAFEALLELQPQDTTALYSLGILSAQAKDTKRAERYLAQYLEVLENQPDNEQDPARIILLLGQLADERGDTDDAIKWLSQIESRPGRNAVYISAQIKMAQMLAKQGRMPEARAKLRNADAHEDEEKVQLLLAESHLLREAENTEEAVTLLEAALKRFPKNTSLLYDYAMVAEKLNRLTVMEDALRKIMSLEPGNQLAYNALGYSLADRNVRLKEARELIEKANKIAPDDAHIMDSVGWVHFRLKNMKEAEKWLRRAYQKRAEAEIAVHLGELLWVTGRKTEAMKFWREAAEKEPKNDTLKNTLKRFNVKR